MEKKIPNKVSEIRVTYHPEVKREERYVITGSKIAYQIFLKIWDMGTIEYTECFYILLLNRGNQVLGFVKISSGGIAGTIVDSRTVFAPALKGCATGIILAHNHPSGNTRPSNEDIELTRNLRKGGKLLNISVLDHLIVTPFDGYLSFSDEGML